MAPGRAAVVTAPELAHVEGVLLGVTLPEARGRGLGLTPWASGSQTHPAQRLARASPGSTLLVAAPAVCSAQRCRLAGRPRGSRSTPALPGGTPE